MFNRINSCSPRFQQQFNYNGSQYPISSNFDQMDTRFRTIQNGFQTDQFHGCDEENERFEESAGVEESEAVDELLQILVECLKRAGLGTQEILLRKCFFEVEKEESLERFLVERIKHSKINLLARKFPGCAGAETGVEISTREVGVSSSSEKMERFKVKTVQVGGIIKEEAG